MAVKITKIGSAALVIMHNPPVNAINKAIRLNLLEAVRELDKDNSVSYVIIAGEGNIFAAGADAREFDSPLAEPHLPDVLFAIENAQKPWVAAINGAALGGGLEIAMACLYRIACPKATLGLPEVTLGLIPGAGGTQRLPRLIGIADAVEMVSTGKPISAEMALKNGLINVVNSDPIAFASKLDIDELLAIDTVSRNENPTSDQAAIEAAKASVAKRARLQLAPPIAISLVEKTSALSFEEGMKEERNAFLKLRESSQAKALRYAFFSERGAKAPKEISKIDPIQVDTAIVVGGGNMGASIAYAMDGIGIETTVIETDQDAAERAKSNLDRLVDGALKRGKIIQEEADAQKKRLSVVVDYSELPKAQLAIEAAFEDIKVKKTIFRALEKALPENAILASNTSYLDLNEIAQSVSNPERVIGLHFFSPAHIMKLLEIVQADATSDLTLSTGYSLAKRLRKIPALSGVCDGFIGNRLLSRYREIADIIMMDGSNPWEVDEAMVNFGYAMGPYEVQDLSGLDIAYANRKRNEATRDPKRRYIPIADRMVNEGRLGRKTNVGWYRYPGGNGKVQDPLVEDLIIEESYFAKVERREFSEQEIQIRLLSAMINEAGAILEEGIAQSASDIDLVLVHGYGFPRWRGGPMFFADEIGLGKILDHIREFEKEDPIIWKPNALLVKLAESGKTFANFGKR